MLLLVVSSLSNDVMYESFVSLIFVVLSSFNVTFLAVFSLLIASSITEFLVALIVIELILSKTKFPKTVWFFKFRVISAPLLPLVPHELSSVLRKLPVLSLFLMVLFSRVIVALEFVKEKENLHSEKIWVVYVFPLIIL